MSEGKNDKAWASLFEKYDILKHIEDKGEYHIRAEEIKEFREPRLMAKFDHRINLPALFKKYHLAILPTSRGSYVISHFDAYHSFESEDDEPIEKLSLPEYLQSLDANAIPSEAIALNCALATGMIADMMDDDGIVATVSGRMSSGDFSFNIGDTKSKSLRKVNVENSQIEIDAAYEGINCLALFEAKRDLSEDFLVRQLYYPFRVWRERVTKPVKPIFLVYSNGIYRLMQYEFDDPNTYSSIRLVKRKYYTIEDRAISVADIENILDHIKIVDEPDIPFPQADTFKRVINLCELLNEKTLSKEQITEKYAFDARQTDYYTNAARYLGLVEKFKDEDDNISFKLTKAGERLLKLNYRQRQLEYCRRILEHRAFHETLHLYFKNGYMPAREEIVGIMKESHLYKVVKEETYKRRAGTITHWLNWIVSLINEQN